MRNVPQSEVSIKLNDKKLAPVDSVKYLGMYIDKHLCWDTHIFHLSKKLSRANGILSKLRHNAPMFTMLYFTPILLMDATYGEPQLKKTWTKL